VKGAVPSYSRLAFMIDFHRVGLSREACISRMQRFGVPMKVFYPIPLYAYSLFRKRRDAITGKIIPFFPKNSSLPRARLPFVEKFCSQQISMEFSPYLSATDALHIGQSLRRLLDDQSN
jgi:dTDP-4-amino-4,6-dideoxygalactose transaminase